jgi:hypothetical protein
MRRDLKVAIMRIGIRLAISGLVLGFILISAAAVHVLWWRTAAANSRLLAATINEQIVAAVEKRSRPSGPRRGRDCSTSPRSACVNFGGCHEQQTGP